ncbi:MAG: ROK family transcriptional regulator [Clostridia bacterium]|nr:ROK family transcriptional regulator [Clostridia bacterium]
MITGSKELIRDINSRLVLETIINHGPISRASIASTLGLTKATISTIVNDLIEKHLVEEIGSDDTSLGRKPILLNFCANSGHILSIDLGVEYIYVLSSDLHATNCSLKQYPNEYDADTIIDGLKNIITQTIEALEKTIFGVVEICIGIHGVVHENQATFTPYYAYENLPFSKILEEHFKIPVLLENEANLSIISEKAFCYNSSDIIGISVHSGLGIGIIIDDKLYTGYNGNAGEFGHSIVVVGGRPCPCGNKGCLEQYASERAILNDYASKVGLTSIDIDFFIQRYLEKEPAAVDMIGQFIRYMSVGINNLLNTFNPEVIVINSVFTMNLPDVIPKIQASLSNRMSNHCILVPSGLQDSSILLGGVCVCIKHFLGIHSLSLKTE